MNIHLRIFSLTLLGCLACQEPKSSSGIKAMIPKRVELVSIQYPKPTVFISKGDIPKEWLRSPTTVDQAEDNNLVSNPSLGSKPIPFGFIHEEWITFKRLMEPGDELWEYSEQGGTGLCIVRAKKVVASLLLTIN